MSESDESRLVKDRNSTPFLFPYFWYYQNNFTLGDKLSKISVKVFTLHEATFVFLGVKKALKVCHSNPKLKSILCSHLR